MTTETSEVSAVSAAARPRTRSARAVSASSPPCGAYVTADANNSAVSVTRRRSARRAATLPSAKHRCVTSSTLCAKAFSASKRTHASAVTTHDLSLAAGVQTRSTLRITLATVSN
jgi:hypothetical protein